MYNPVYKRIELRIVGRAVQPSRTDCTPNRNCTIDTIW